MMNRRTLLQAGILAPMGFGLAEAIALRAAAQASPATVTARLADEARARAQQRERETAIRAACALAKLPELTDGYVAGGMSLDQVKAQLAVLVAKLDKVEIDASLGPDQITRGPRTVNRAAAYKQFNQTPA